MNKHPVIDKWAQKKYNRPEGTEFLIEQETIEHGFCPTCWFSTEVVIVYEMVEGSMVKIDELSTDIPSLLNDLLDDSDESQERLDLL